MHHLGRRRGGTAACQFWRIFCPLMMTSPDPLMVICLPSIVISPFFFIVIVAEPVFSTISSPAVIAIFLPTSSVSFSPTLVERSLPTDVVSLPATDIV